MANSKLSRKDRLSEYRMISLQRKPKLGCTKSWTGPHAAYRPRVGHSCLKGYYWEQL